MSENDIKLIGLCIAGIDAEYNSVFLDNFISMAEDYHCRVLCFYSFSPIYFKSTHDDGEQKIFDLINYDVLDSLILLGQNCQDRSVMNRLAQRGNQAGIPVISIDRPLDVPCYHLDFDYEKALRELIVHMIEKHDAKRINFIAGGKGNSYSEQRVDIYREVLTQYGIPVEEERIGYGEFWSEPTKRVIDDFVSGSLPFPDTIVCANDSMAITAYERLTQKGYRIPEDVRLTGFDGIKQALHHLPLITTAKHSIPDAVKATYELLINLFQGKKCDSRVLVPSNLIIGSTCGCNMSREANFNRLLGDAYDEMTRNKIYQEHQIAMLSHLTSNQSFQAVFEATKKYFMEEIPSECFWICVNDSLLLQEELSDILEENQLHASSYSSRMVVTLHKNGDTWEGIEDFATDHLLPKLMEHLDRHKGLVFFPLHIQDQTLGYAVVSMEHTEFPMERYYQFINNISTALNVTKAIIRQNIIIENLENKYVHDPMTGLFNRRGFYQKVVGLFNHQQEEQKLFSIFSVDLNGLKPINDNYGHSDGDIAITTVGKALMHCSQSGDVCARFGGDEFVVATAPDRPEDAEDYIKRIRQYLEDFNQSSGKPYQVSASIGYVCAVPNKDITLDGFINHADEKMYEEKAKHHLSRGR